MLENDIEVWYRAIDRFYYVFTYYIPTAILYRKYMSQVVFAFCTLNIHMQKLAWVQRVNIQKITEWFQQHRKHSKATIPT